MTQLAGPQEFPEFTIHDRCRKARESARLDQTELAQKIDVSRGTIVNYETGKVSKLKPLVLRQWALACGVSFEWLLMGGSEKRGNLTRNNRTGPGRKNLHPRATRHIDLIAAERAEELSDAVGF